MEYGRIVGESTRVGGGSGGGDVTGRVMDTLSDAVDQIATLPPEVLIGAAVVAVIGLVFFRR
ncbi:MAG: hypothetical protein PVG27_01260 [Chloroflexota bacterium]|jgi:hypothetical protein